MRFAVFASLRLGEMAEDGFEIKFLIEAAKRGNEDQVEVQLQKGDDVNLRDALGNTALHWAASGGHTDVVKVRASLFFSPPPMGTSKSLLTSLSILKF